MNTRNSVPPSQEVITQAVNILAIAMSTPTNIADVFVQWSPHCQSLDVSGHSFGWHENKSAEFKRDLYFHHSKDALAELTQVREDLMAYIADCEKAGPAERAESDAKALRAQAAKLLAEADSLSPVQS